MSTYTNYLLLTRDYSRTLNNLGKTAQISNAAQYYQANIGNVKSVDDLMKNNRLYNYAVKAAGLEDMAYAKAFMRKVLMSDLSDVDSFANKLTDKRYVDFAKMFNFGTDGKVASVTDVQSTQQELDLVGLYNQRIIEKDRLASEKVIAYSAAVDAMTSVDDLFTKANRPYLEIALTAYGMGDDAKNASSTFLREIVVRGVADSGSPLYSITNVAYRDKLSAFVSAFNFAPSGTVNAGEAQSQTQKAATIAGYLDLSGEASKSSSLLFSADTYRQNIGNITSVSDLLNNQFLLNFVKTAYKLDAASTTDITAALQSDHTDPASAANQLGLNFRRLAEDFNFDSSGNVPSGQDVQDADAIERTASRYLANANSVNSVETSDYTTYRLTINKAGWIENLEDFLDVLTGGNPDTGTPKTVPDELSKSMKNFIFRTFGLDTTVTYDRNFLRDVMTSDLNDPGSFANSQTYPSTPPATPVADRRWASLASYFNFDPSTGNVVGSVQTTDQLAEMAERFIAQGFGGSTAQQAMLSFKYEMRDVRNVDDFLNSKSAFTFALMANGYPKTQASKDYFRRALTDPSALNDPDFVSPLERPKLEAFVAAFNFQADGSLPTNTPAMTVLKFDETVERFMGEAMPGTGDYNLRSAQEYTTAIANIRTVDQFLSAENAQYFNFAMSAFGIDMTKTTKQEIGDILKSNLADPTSIANKLGGRFLELAEAFNFDISGYVPPALATQSAAQLQTTVNSFLARNNPASTAQISGATTTFKQRIASLESAAALSGRKPVDEFLNNANLYSYALIAVGLDPTTESKSKIRQALTADRTKTSNFLNQFGNDKYKALADLLNFDPDGSIGTPRIAQSTADAAILAKKYKASYPTDSRPKWAPNTPTAQENVISTETDYYAVTIQTINSVEQLTADKRLVSYISKAFGFEPNSLRASDLNKILTSDLSDPKSFANTGKDLRFKEMAALFNFDKDGKTKRLPEQAVQSSGGIYQTYMNYLQQTLEVEEGKSNPGVRLALYFARKAPTLTSTFAILGDKALFEVARTALGIPNEAARADIDVLARTIEKKLNIADLKDPKKLESFVKRFIAMYDVQNGGGTSVSSNSLSLIQGGSDIGFSQDMIQSLQSVRARRF